MNSQSLQEPDEIKPELSDEWFENADAFVGPVLAQDRRKLKVARKSLQAFLTIWIGCILLGQLGIDSSYLLFGIWLVAMAGIVLSAIACVVLQVLQKKWR